ncbi:MAG: hypothetical protein ABFD75_09165 [Smithella sp.]
MTNFLRIIGKEYNFRQYLVIFLCIYLFALVAGFLLQGAGTLFDVRSLLISVALVILILGMICHPLDKIFCFWAMIAIIFLIFIFPRIMMYMLTPAIVTFPFGKDINRTTVFIGLTYVLLGMASLAIGQLLYEKFMSKMFVSGTMASNSASFCQLPLLAIVFLIFLIIQIYISCGLGISPYLLNARMSTFWANTFVQLICVIIDADMLLLICFITILGRSDLSKTSRWSFAIGIATCYLFASAYLGSRGGSMRLLIILLAVLLACYGNFRVSIYRILCVMSLLMVIGWVSFPFATMQRMKSVAMYNTAAQELVDDKAKEDIEAKAKFKELFIIKAKKRVEESLLAETAENITTILNNNLIMALINSKHILDRIGVLDYAILVVTQSANTECKKRIMTIDYTFKSLINSVPGTPFPEAELNTSRLVSALFRPETPESYLKVSGYHSEPYTAWGLSFLFFGWWGGLLALGIVGAVLVALQDISRIGQWNIYRKALFFWIMPSIVILSMGVDHSIFLVFVEYLRLTVALIILFALTALVSSRTDALMLKWRKSSGITRN